MSLIKKVAVMYWILFILALTVKWSVADDFIGPRNCWMVNSYVTNVIVLPEGKKLWITAANKHAYYIIVDKNIQVEVNQYITLGWDSNGDIYVVIGPDKLYSVAY